MGDLNSFLSRRVGALGDRVDALIRRHEALWRAAPEKARPPNKRYSRARKKAVEKELSGLVECLSSEPVRTAFLEGTLEEARLEEMAAGLRPAFKRLLGLIDLPLDAVYDARFIDSTRRFLQAARDFDPGLSLASAYQALRNVWIMNSLQFDLGRDVESNEAVFAYSMVYPYLDNVLDDAGTAESGKLALVGKLRDWLEGLGTGADTPEEERVHTLVALIERRYPREAFPGLYQSLLAIFNAQVRSLLQQRPGSAASTDDILSISFEKGGTSVLADGYLVAGTLSPADEAFCFGFGTILQLGDDLQDISEDTRRGHQTLFSGRRGRDELDATAARLEGFLAAVLGEARPGATARRSALCDAIEGGLGLMFRESVGKHGKSFGRAFVRRARQAFPARFSYLEKLRRRLQDSLPEGRDRLADLDNGLVALMAVSTRAFTLD
jgi:hypothetical protein